MKKILSCVLSLALILSCMVVPALAANTTVSTYDEFVSAVNNAADGDTIFVSANITIAQDITIGNVGKQVTIKSAVSGGHLITVQDCTVTFQSLSFVGNQDYTNTTYINIKSGSHTTFNDCNFTSIAAASIPVVMDGNNGNTFTRCNFEGNSGVSTGCLSVSNCTAIFNVCTFINNTATSGVGAVRYFSSQTNSNKYLSLNTCTLRGNTGTTGGAVFTSSATGAKANSGLNACIITGNSAESGGGVNSADTILTLTDTAVYGNTATQSGADFYFLNTDISYSCAASTWDDISVTLNGYYTDTGSARYSADSPTEAYTLGTASGVTKILATAYSSLSADLTIGSASVKAGQNIEIPISISNNNGVACIAGEISYNADALTLTGVVSELQTGSFYYNEENHKFIWYDTADYTGEGDIITLSFTAADITDDYTVTLAHNTSDICNSAGNTISLNVIPGTVTIYSFVLGDANGDNAVTAADVVYLARYIIGLETTIDSNAADVNEDGNIDGRDVVKLARYMVGLETLEG